MIHAVITEPLPGQFVPHEVRIAGLVGDAYEKTFLRTIVIPAAEQLFHPQAGTLSLNPANHEFYGQTYVGNRAPESNTGERFRILVVQCTNSANNVINKYLQEAVDKRWPGLSELPAGCDVLVEVTVARDDVAAREEPMIKRSLIATPEKMTIKWLRDNVSVSSWLKLGSLFAGIFLCGVSVGQSRLYAYLTTPNADPSSTVAAKSGQPVITAPPLPLASAKTSGQKQSQTITIVNMNTAGQLKGIKVSSRFRVEWDKGPASKIFQVFEHGKEAPAYEHRLNNGDEVALPDSPRGLVELKTWWDDGTRRREQGVWVTVTD